MTPTLPEVHAVIDRGPTPGAADLDWDSRLRADCGSCFGLCCTALSFAASADFAFDKPAGEPCVNLQADYRCGIHPVLRESGFKGCTVFDCFGAGQQVSQITYAGRSWRDAPDTAGDMFGVFTVMRQLHELLWYLTQAVRLAPPGPLRNAVVALRDETARLTDETADALLSLNINGHRDQVNVTLAGVSEAVRARAPRPEKGHPKTKGKKGGAPKIRPGADLIGASLRAADLRGVNLRAAYLIAADLRDADLRFADLIGADLRDADLSGADLSTTLFVTQSQLNSARGDGRTRLPEALARPTHWT